MTFLLQPVDVEETRDHSSPFSKKQKKSILLQFPPHRAALFRCLEDLDLFLTKKENLLRKWNHNFRMNDLEFQKDLLEFETDLLEFEISASLSMQQASSLLEQIISAARIFYLDEVELYFMEDASSGPFSPINELESLSMILFELRSLMTSDTETDGKEVLQHMEKQVLYKIKALVYDNADLYSDNELCEVDSAFEMLENWGRSKNIKKKLMIAKGGRGLIASEDIDIGDIVLEIPLSLLMGGNFETPMYSGRAEYINFIRTVDQIMIERSKPNSDYSIFFKSLPKEFKTGLSFTEDALKIACGTGLAREINSVKSTLDDHFHKSRLNVQFTREDYKWANELLLSHGVGALLPNGTLTLCLTPFAGFFNHSLFPHVLHGELHRDSLRFIASRPCSKGQQCYLTYTNLSGAELATNYGYLPKGKNHHDVILIDPYLGAECFEETWEVEGDPEWSLFMVRMPLANTGINCLPKALIDQIQTVVRTCCNVLQHRVEPIARDTLREFFLTRLLALDHPMSKVPEEKLQNLNWDVKLALEYKEIERKILRSAISACDSSPRRMMIDD